MWFAEWVSIPGMGGLAVVHVQDEPVRCCLGSDQAQGLNRRRGSRGSWFQFLLQAQALRPTPCNLPVDACLHSLLATNHPRHATCDRSNSRMPAGNAIAIHHCAPNCSVLGCLPAIFFRDRAGMRRTYPFAQAIWSRRTCPLLHELQLWTREHVATDSEKRAVPTVCCGKRRAAGGRVPHARRSISMKSSASAPSAASSCRRRNK